MHVWPALKLYSFRASRTRKNSQNYIRYLTRGRLIKLCVVIRLTRDGRNIAGHIKLREYPIREAGPKLTETYHAYMAGPEALEF